MALYSESSLESESPSTSSDNESLLQNPAAAMLVSPCSSSSDISASPPLSPFRRENIAVSDTGTEVTLRDHHGKAETPATITTTTNVDDEDEDEHCSSSSKDCSLLDNDLSSVTTTTAPLYSPEITRSPISTSILPLCGVGGCWSATPEESSSASSGPVGISRAAACMDDGLQDYLYQFLSDPTSSVGDQKSFPWQAMLTSMVDADDDSDDDDEDDDDGDDAEEREIKKHRMKILRNRAIHLHARKERLDTLRRDLHPFSSPPVTPPPTGTGSSWAMIGGNGNILPRSQSQPISAPTKPRRKPLQDRTHYFHPPQVWSSWSCHNIPQSPNALVWEDDDINEGGSGGGENHHVCYDSDPEDFVRSSRSSNTSTPPPLPSLVKNKRKNNNLVSAAAVSDDDLFIAGTNNNNLYDIVHGAFNERWTFILHPESVAHHTGGGKNPCAVQAWMERGQRLSTTVIPPKLVYQFIGKTTSSSSSSSFSSSNTTRQQPRPRVLGTTPLYSIDLLEIQRVLEIHRVNRELYPFAKAPNTFTITTLSETICLEASSNSERDRIVRLLKLLVARFGSQLVTGDYRVEDFFTMIGNGPGGAQVEYYNRMH